MTWPPPQFDQPPAQRDLRVLVLAGQPYIHMGDLADWLLTQTKKAQPSSPVVLDTVAVIVAEIRNLNGKAVRKCTDHRGDAGERGELSA